MNEEVYQERVLGRSPAFLFRRISWGAVFAGGFVALTVQLLFTLLGVALGGSLNVEWLQNLAQGLTMPGAIWILVTGLISLYVGAFTAGRLCGGPRRADGMLHGLVTWSVSILAMTVLAASLTGTLAGGLGTLVRAAALGAAQPEVSMNSEQGNAGQGLALAPTGRPENPNPNANQDAGLSMAWWGFIALITGAIVAGWGGWAGTASLPLRVEARNPVE